MNYQFEDLRKDKRLLLVDTDDRLLRTSSKYYFRRKGYKTAGARTPEEVLNFVKDFHP